MSHLNSTFDPDFDPFLDLDQDRSTPSLASPDLSKGKETADSRPSLSTSTSNSFIPTQSQQTFSGPSFQYGSYRQQTGLPVGGLANTLALNQATGMQYLGSNHGFVTPTETLNMPLSNLEDFDYGQNHLADMSDIDLELESPSDSLSSMYYSSASSGQFINPNALVEQREPSSFSTPVQRMYPGIHTQQAAQAKAQQAQKQQEMLRQQQKRHLAGQKPLPSSSKPQPQKDPHVEESISRLLHQMRQNSVASIEDDASTPTGSMPNIARLKKEEDDMDEDERLLASEEGKKLSSKERRQLRNKVSARAFRSRRKEYIGQLEGEVAAKVQEANDLRVQNRQLMEENTRLTDLTRMLLSSQAFSGFLNELSQNGLPPPTTTANASQAQPRPTEKDVNPHQATRQLQNNQAQVGMAVIPESTVDFSMLEVNPSSSWISGFGSQNYQVCAVTEIPEGPAIDVTMLSGKTSGVSESFSSSTKDLPVLEKAPFHEAASAIAATSVNEEVVLDDTAFALFLDQPKAAPATTEPTSVSRVDFPRKAVGSNQFVLTPRHPEIGSWEQLEAMCSHLDATCEQLSLLTSHLS